MKKLLLVLVLSLTLIVTACSAAWVSTLDGILAAGAPALTNILEIVSVSNGKPMDANLAAKITADAAAIKKLAADLSLASSDSASGVCHQLEAVVSTFQGDEQLVLQVAQVSNANTQTKIMLLADLVAGTISAITAVIPSCQASPKTFRASPPPSLAGFADGYNKILVAPTGNPAVDALTPKLKLHRRHSTFTKVVTLGIVHD